MLADLKHPMRIPLLLSLASLSLSAFAAPADAVPPVETAAAPGPWSVTLRATYLVTTDGSTAGVLPKDAVSVEDKLIPEFDVGYRINDQWALELVLTVPQEHEVKVLGGAIGDFKHLPPTLLAKYRPGEWAGFSPYVGAGVNFTLIFDEDLAGGALKLDTFSVGPAAQIGADYALNERWSLNLDVKRMLLRTDVKTTGGAKITRLELDPWLLAVGVNRSF